MFKDSQVVFVAIPRTASRAMHDALMTIPSAEVFAIHVPSPVRHHWTFVPERARGYTMLYCVRNPYERLVSHYRFQKRFNDPTISFRAFVKMQGDRLMSDTIESYTQDATKREAMKFEALGDEWNRATDKLFGRVPQLEYRGEGESLAHEWRKEYDSETADMVCRMMAEDFLNYDYDPDSWQ